MPERQSVIPLVALAITLQVNLLAGIASEPTEIPPPNPVLNCWVPEGTNPSNKMAQIPTPFLFQPFDMEWSGDFWSTLMDHTNPNYGSEDKGSVAALGEILADQLKMTRYWNDEETVSYDYYMSPSLELLFGYDGHDGHDFSTGGQTGRIALAAGDGQVVRVQAKDVGPLGRFVDIYHQEGYLTRYGHLAETYVTLTTPYTTVSAGDPIGEIGNSGSNTTGIHLHFSVYRWDSSRNEWQITDPFGWDPWLSPGQQDSDPLRSCNGEISYNLWVHGWPSTKDGQKGTSVYPTVRSIGGWLEETDRDLQTLTSFSGYSFDDLSSRFTRSGAEWQEFFDGYEDHYWLAPNGDGTTSANWLLNPTSSGVWEVFVFINKDSTSQHATYQIHHSNKTDTVVVNQSIYDDEWVSLGKFSFAGQGNEYISLPNDTGEPFGTTILSYDAAGIIWVGDDLSEFFSSIPVCSAFFSPMIVLAAIRFRLKQKGWAK
jgi:murein DD-endopeptidase MepM/ murein hydrolase activator NlpD